MAHQVATPLVLRPQRWLPTTNCASHILRQATSPSDRTFSTPSDRAGQRNQEPLLKLSKKIVRRGFF
eukprot:3887881-Amphidinium_carterae.1